MHAVNPKGLITLTKVASKSAIMRLCDMLNRKILRTEIMVLHLSTLQIIFYSHSLQGFLITLTFSLNTVKSKAPGPPPTALEPWLLSGEFSVNEEQILVLP